MASDTPLIPSLPPRRSGRSSWEVFLTTLHAFMLRELKNQFGRSRLGYFWAVAEPAAQVAIFTGIHGVIRGGHSQLYQASPIVFFVFGVIPYLMFSNALSQAQGVCGLNRGMFTYRQIKPIDVMLARALIDGLTIIAVLLVFLAGWAWFGGDPIRMDLLELCAAMGGLFVLGFALGLFFEVIGTVFPDMRKIFAVITRPLFFVSGVFFSIGMLPTRLGEILMFNPILHGVDLARDAVLPAYDSPASWAYLFVWAGLLLFLGLAVYRRYLFRLY